jgi:glycosyltransferase involved in cell wall biosynthesis
MKVLFTSTDNPHTTHLGGKHIHLLLLEKGLRSLGVDITTLYYDRQDPKEFLKRSTLILLTEKARFRKKVNWMIDYLRKNIPKKEFNIVHAHDALSILAVGQMPQRKVLTLHGYFARENIEFVKDEKDREAIYPELFELEKDAMSHASYVIAVDQRLRDYVISEFNWSADKITVIHNAVDTDLFEPATADEQRILKSNYGISNEQFVILVPRRLVEKNGVIYAVRAMKHLKNNNVKMIIAGDGPERNAIAKEAEGDSRIDLAGTIPHDKIDSYYKMADAILIPSITSHGIQEATSLSMLEGMSAGKVVICSEIGGMREIIQDMKNGMFVQEKQPQSIAEAIETAIEDQSLRIKIGNEAREYVLQNHSFVAHARKTAQLYRKVLGEGENAQT